ncbi:MAG: nicotinamide mononucleotide transporter [Bacteroidales bacterium]|nr:nicotinamide mononucleotide transporter [Bacteroidales bacterium]
METIIRIIEIFALVTGVAYVVLEILQKNAMWVLGILTGAACAFSFGVQHVWASMGLNIYYVVVSFIGLWQWKKDGAQVGEGEIHIRPLTPKVQYISTLVYVIGLYPIFYILKASGDPAPLLDAASTLLSVIATWWLAKSYLRQWLLWIGADLMSTWLCIDTGQWWMAVLYAVYAASAVYGYFHWKKRGKVVS